MDRSEKVEAYFNEEHPFKDEIGLLRHLALKTQLDETFKWMFPTYTLNGKNVLAICKFKKHFGIWFFNGVFLSDPYKVLENAQEGKTQAMRQWKFTTSKKIDPNKILGYFHEAIENQKKGLTLVPKKKAAKKVTIPEPLKSALAEHPEAHKNFKTLSTYRQNEFSEYIADAKQEKTKLSRLQKILPMILDGKGLNDKYKR